MSEPSLPTPSIRRRPLYRQVADDLRAILETRQPGDLLGTEAAFTRRYGVSVSTVRAAFAELEREGLIERRQGGGTFVSPRPVQRRHVAVVMELDVAGRSLSPFYPRFLQELRLALGRVGLRSRPYLGYMQGGMLPGETSTCDDLMDDLALDRIVGMAAVGVAREFLESEFWRKMNLPAVSYDLLRANGINRNTEHFVRSALAHFKERGRRRIAVIGWENPVDGRNPMTKALEKLAPEYGVTLIHRWIDLSADASEQGMGWERFREIWNASTERPDGLMVIDDMLFADCQKAICELRIDVPEALDVVLRTSDAMAFHAPFPLLVWELQTASLAALYATALKALLNGEEPPAIDELPCTVKIVNGAEADADPFIPREIASQPFLSLL
ncbi:MAG TPA: substrate-binding domain-containing protein [Chthoniobacteraceae bacterium]|nr:substrate-binding domain-containing protein [Chthoniobacteraceae bacterium]